MKNMKLDPPIQIICFIKMQNKLICFIKIVLNVAVLFCTSELWLLYCYCLSSIMVVMFYRLYFAKRS